MEVKFKGSRREAARRIRELVQDVLRNPTHHEVRAVYEAIGQELKQTVHDEYLVKSAGGTDAGGITWKLTKRGKPMMIDTRRLLESFEFEVLPDGVRLFSNLEYAKFALAKRPAWGQTIPQEWWHRIIEATTRAVLELIQQRLR